MTDQRSERTVSVTNILIVHEAGIIKDRVSAYNHVSLTLVWLH